MTRSFSVTPKTTEQHLIASSDKSVAYVTNNKDSVRRFVLLKLTTDRHEATRGLFETAELLFSNGVIYAAFNCVGNTPDDSDLLNSSVMNGSSTSALSLRRCVGSGPVAHCLARSLRTASMTSSTLRAQKDDKSQSGGFIYIKIHIRR